MPMASAMEKNLPWKSKNGIPGNHSFMLMPKNDPHSRPNATVIAPHSVANHAACRIMLGFRFRESIHTPSSVRMAP